MLVEHPAVSCQANILQVQKSTVDFSTSWSSKLRKHGEYAWHLVSACSSCKDVEMQIVLCHNNALQQGHAHILELLNRKQLQHEDQQLVV